ncbi:uncharacterized protein Z518_03983 [Rhinocladiella mackenziei CBS 650.93]|uniref:Rhinocladiella mackenziei CBS 650.93 unplaced genomic scaffold supercont1.3, whole genome shotgun sequence n=1 Tax=Rhinocladiella mackenziei CBS 650.93 TaxID=1442369 RepID=A0A0D2IK03_9EURO|nr:uncharacterized protein Z518_03983 [Rhinocladiella mackenziei CBS 650.93]KIX06009.1 hypothetical protein Z518_03983 [Rhinocladiella mackenziei CBS 650.93]
MVRVEVGGKPIIDVDTTPGDAARFKQQKIRGNGRAVHLSWDVSMPRVVLTSDTDEFDPTTISYFQEEGFRLSYLAYEGNHADYVAKLQQLQDPLELGERYAIVAYGDAAALVLEACMKPMPKLAAVVAYYPPHMPNTTTSFPPTLNVQIHLASSQKFGTRHPSYRYTNTHPGFAEYDLEEFDKISASLAWSRTLALLRTAFDIEGVDLEAVWENHTRFEFVEKDVDKTMATMVPQPYLNHIPTMTGGIGYDELRRFYADFFIPGNPPDLSIRLLSRTVGADRVVDEMFVKFTHTTEIPWMLPGVPPTDKTVEVVLVSVVCVRGGRLFHEHIHWDQATVLVQIGLIDPTLIPKTFKTAEEGREREIERLPVLGREAARKVLDEDSSKSNQLIPEW